MLGHVAERLALSGDWMGQRVLADPYLRAGGLLPAARSLRAVGGAWSYPRERKALPLPTAARQRQRLGPRSYGLSSVPGSSCGSGDNGAARCGSASSSP